MANPEHIAKLKEGVGAWNRWRGDHFRELPDLSGADLLSVNLTRANLSSASLERGNLRLAQLIWADLSGANLADSCLNRADLGGANLRRANLSRADLAGADLSRADLSGADLSGADLSGAHLRDAQLEASNFSGVDLSRADLRGANLDRAVIAYTVFGNNDLRTVKQLETAWHSGPSTVGIDTIYRSRGDIPEIFLRGAGLPDNFISYMKSLAGTPSAYEFYSCFISYSAKDQDFGDRLYADLQNKGVRCWFAPHDIKAGEKIHEQIDEAIRLHDKLLLILSPYSMESEWVKTEIATARNREMRDQRRVLFPIRLVPFEILRDWKCFDADTGKDSAREIREYFIPDFSNWKNHDPYREAFERLLKDLKAQD